MQEYRCLFNVTCAVRMFMLNKLCKIWQRFCHKVTRSFISYPQSTQYTGALHSFGSSSVRLKFIIMTITDQRGSDKTGYDPYKGNMIHCTHTPIHTVYPTDNDSYRKRDSFRTLYLVFTHCLVKFSQSNIIWYEGLANPGGEGRLRTENSECTEQVFHIK